MRIFPLSESAITVEFGDQISLELNETAVALARTVSADPFPGFIEAVPAYASVTIFFDPIEVRRKSETTAFECVEKILNEKIEDLRFDLARETRMIEIPITMTADSSLDLASICEFSGLSEEGSIEIFLSKTYRVYMLGFLPGFSYMGEVDERIAAPRLKTPRTKVPKGSVGIAGKQTGIYPLESPGGWNIIGRTDLGMFDPASSDPCLLKPGDEVRFIRVG